MKFEEYLVQMVGSDMAKRILSMPEREKRRDIILIMGNQKATGKTTLKNILRRHGYVALEPHDCSYCIELNDELQSLIPQYENRVE